MSSADRAASGGDTRYRYGVLLPHFGSAASRERIVDDSRRLEEYGLDSVWARDHIVYRPHSHEDQDRTHVDPFVTLTAVAAATTGLGLGTGTLIPHRHPIYAALLLGSLDFVAGPDRVIAGFGIGTYDHEFESVGLGGIVRKTMIEEYVAILRKLWTGEAVTHHGENFSFEDVEIHPVPGKADGIPVWYGGASKAAVRRAVEYCDGSLHGWTPVRVFADLIARMRRLANDAGKALPDVGIIPVVAPATSSAEGLRQLNAERLFSMAKRFYGPPPGKEDYGSAEDLDDAALVGDAASIAAGIRRFQAAGARHVIFDMRHSFERWDELVKFVGEELLPLLHQEDGRAPERGEEPEG